MADNKVGEAYVEIDARTAKLQKGLKDAERQTEQSGRKIQGSLKGVGTAIDGATEGVRKFSGAVGAAFGVFTQWVGIIGLVVAAYETLKRLLGENREEIEKLNQEVERASQAYISSAEAARTFQRAIRSDTLDPVQAQVQALTDQFDAFKAAQDEAYSAGAIGADEVTRRIREGREELEKRVDRIFEAEEAQKEANKALERQAELDAEITEAKLAHLEAIKAIRQEQAEARRQEEEARRAEEEAARQRERDLEAQRAKLEEIRNLMREINTLGVNGTAGNVGSVVSALGASRVRKGP